MYNQFLIAYESILVRYLRNETKKRRAITRTVRRAPRVQPIRATTTYSPSASIVRNEVRLTERQRERFRSLRH